MMNNWFKLSAFSFLAVVLMFCNGCRSPYYSDQLTLAGGLTGAGIGAVVGEATGNPESGALIGAVTGAITGNVIGESMDAAEARNRAIIQSQMGRELQGAATIHDVITMSQAGLSEDIIIRHIQYSRMASPPTSADLVLLSQAGVADNVILAVQGNPLPSATPTMPPRVIVKERYVPAPPCHWRYPYPDCHYHDYHHGHHSHGHGIGWGFSFHD